MKINKRDTIKAIGAFGALSAMGSGAHAASQNKPNVIFILADDLGYKDVSIMGSDHIRTPNIDSIGRGGIKFTNGYSNSAVCSPTRTAVATGCYQQRFRIGLEEPFGSTITDTSIGLPQDTKTIATEFKRLGYKTGLVGKWHIGTIGQHGPLEHGYEYFFGLPEGGADYFTHHVMREGRPIGKGLMENNIEVERNGYLTDVFGDEAVKYIQNNRNNPFMLSLHFNAPHWPWEDRNDIEVSRNLRSIFHYDGGTIETYANMVMAMDDNIGKVLRAVRSIGKERDTIIVFTSDNGGERFSDNWPFSGVKGELLEGGIRVPVLIKWPARIRRNQTLDQPIISMDYVPTLLAAAGDDLTNSQFDGMNLLPQLLGAPKVERTIYWRYKANEQAAVREGDWKYLKLGGKEHLFNVAIDPRERANKATLEPAIFARLKQKHADWNAQMLPYPTSGNFSEDVKTRYPDRY